MGVIYGETALLSRIGNAYDNRNALGRKVIYGKLAAVEATARDKDADAKDAHPKLESRRLMTQM